MRWKKAIDEVATLPCILLGNKVDLVKEDKDEDDNKLKEFATKNGFCEAFRTSTKTGLNINKSFEYLINTIIQRMKSTNDPNIAKDNKISVDNKFEKEKKEEEEKEENKKRKKFLKINLILKSQK